LASGINGDVFLYRWQREECQEAVAVKQLQNRHLNDVLGAETNERTVHLEAWKRAPPPEDPLAEIGVLRYLAQQPDVCPYILQLRGVFAEDSATWLVTELADGGELFEVAAAGPIPESGLRRYMQQLLQAVAYLHRHHIGHRDISLENVLIKGGDVRLMDFGMAVRSHSSTGVPLRFFRAVGKDYYRAPEVYVPAKATTRAVAPSALPPEGSTAMVKAAGGYLCEVKLPPEAEPRQPCTAEVWGYAAQPADVFAVGICLFIMAWQCPPWRKALLSDRMFAFAHSLGDGGAKGLLQHWGFPLLTAEAMQLLAEMLRSEPSQRPSAAMCLNSSWFSAMVEEPVQLDAQPALAEEAVHSDTVVGGAAAGAG